MGTHHHSYNVEHYELIHDDLTSLEVHPDRIDWVHVEGGTDAELDQLAEKFGMHRLVREDIGGNKQRPKVEEYGEHVFVVARIPGEGPGDPTLQVSFFLGDAFLLSFCQQPTNCFDGVLTRIEQGGPRIRRFGADYLMYALIDAVIDAYFPIADTIAEGAEEIERVILAGADDELLVDLLATKRHLRMIRQVLAGHREALRVLSRDELTPVSDTARVYLRDCHDHCIRILELMEGLRDQTSDLVDFYLSQASHRMNEVMKVLTIIATIFIPLGFLAGLYGMNFENMPELKQPWGYPGLLTLMFLVVAGMLTYFRRRGWLGGSGRRR